MNWPTKNARSAKQWNQVRANHPVLPTTFLKVSRLPVLSHTQPHLVHRWPLRSCSRRHGHLPSACRHCRLLLLLPWLPHSCCRHCSPSAVAAATSQVFPPLQCGFVVIHGPSGQQQVGSRQAVNSAGGSRPVLEKRWTQWVAVLSRRWFAAFPAWMAAPEYQTRRSWQLHCNFTWYKQGRLNIAETIFAIFNEFNLIRFTCKEIKHPLLFFFYFEHIQIMFFTDLSISYKLQLVRVLTELLQCLEMDPYSLITSSPFSLPTHASFFSSSFKRVLPPYCPLLISSFFSFSLRLFLIGPPI